MSTKVEEKNNSKELKKLEEEMLIYIRFIKYLDGICFLIIQ